MFVPCETQLLAFCQLMGSNGHNLGISIVDGIRLLPPLSSSILLTLHRWPST